MTSTIATRPTFTTPKRQAGIAGSFAYKTTVTYEGETPTVLTFIGSVYGGPIIMVTQSGVQVPVRDADRFGGRLNAQWVEAFLRAS